MVSDLEKDVDLLLILIDGGCTHNHLLAIRDHYKECRNTQPLMGTVRICKYEDALKYIQRLSKEKVIDLSRYFVESQKALQTDFKEHPNLPKTIVDLVENEEARELLQKEFDY